MSFNFKFSIIISVYNMEKYLKKSVDSVINQDIGFENNVQVIIVDDGSTDKSLEIAKQYQCDFPENILVLNQKHKGLAHARNLGLEHVEGKYVNFLDADDYFSTNTLSNVYDFFQRNYFLVDVVSIPIEFFEGSIGNHELNKKDSSGGIVNLNKNPNNPQMSLSSSFLKYNSLRNHSFNTDLIFSDDTLLINKIILKKEQYGFLESSEYYFRIRRDLSNLSNQVMFNKSYYSDRLNDFHLNLIEYSLSNKCCVPKFIQATILYDLLNILKLPEIDIFDDTEEKNEFFKFLKKILSYIDEDIIFENKFLKDQLLKQFIMCLKNGDKTYELQDGNICLKFGDYVADNLSKHKFWIDNIEFSEDYLHISGFYNSLFDIKNVSFLAAKEKNGKRTHYHGTYIKNNGREHIKFLSEIFQYSNSFYIKIPTEDLPNSKISLRVNFHINGNKEEFGDNVIYSYLSLYFTNKSNLSRNFELSNQDFTIRHRDKDLLVSRNFKFSVVMAVYNTEDYLKEAVDSLINQTIGFEKNIQLIFVNDGSIDSSEEIMTYYESKFPDNIIIVNQENQGQAAARNNGLNYVNGKYVNFLDSDDYLSDNAMEEVYKFYEKHGSEIDVVAIPLVQFGRTTAHHFLDYKFNKSRVIDLVKNPNHPQLHVSSTFIKFDSIKNIRFPTNITGSEDGNFVNNILLKKQKLGVIKDAAYNYRKRFDESSTLDTMVLKEDYYIPRLKYHFMDLISKSLDKYGKIPLFIQYTLIYDLQWLIAIPTLDILTKQSEKKEFWFYINKIISCMDFKVIAPNVNIKSKLAKQFMIYLKNKDLHYEIDAENNVFLKTADYNLDTLNKHKLWLDIVEIKNGFLNISGFLNSLFDINTISIEAIKSINGKTEHYKGKYVKYTNRKGVKFLDNQWQYSYTYDLKIPLEENEKSTIDLVINFHIDGNNTNFKDNNIISMNLDIDFLKHVRISKINNYIVNDNHILQFENNSFSIVPYSYKYHWDIEKVIRKEINEIEPMNYKHMIRLRFCYLVLYPFIKNKKIYLFMDRRDSADDNAEHLFKYASSKKDGVKKYFVLSKKSMDFSRISKFGKVVKFNSFKHRLLYLFADKVISSHPDESILNPFFAYENENDQRKYFNGLVTSGTYFLQHGVTKDDISYWLKKYDKNLSLIVTVSDDETNSLLNEGYNYEKDIIQPLGFPRFDNLKNNSNNKILIIPTWRDYLEGDRRVFMSSDYYKCLNKLVNDVDLIDFCDENGYEIIFKGHPKLEHSISEEDNERYIDLFDFNEKIRLSTKESYQQLFAEASLLITDFSSVCFDFAYLKKPVIYYQPNDDYHHSESYFVYEDMGFGEVIKNHEYLVQTVKKYIKNDCSMEVKYQKRVDSFFKHIDKKNCQRVYDWIINH